MTKVEKQIEQNKLQMDKQMEGSCSGKKKFRRRYSHWYIDGYFIRKSIVLIISESIGKDSDIWRR